MSKHKLVEITTNNAAQTKLSEEVIAARAYERWLAKGCPISDGTEDWFAACAELEQQASNKTNGANRGHQA